jgi:hypothetical protein
MKIQKMSLSVLLLIVLASSCRKNDFLEEQQPIIPEASSSFAADSTNRAGTADSSGWKSSSDWKVAVQESFSVYYLNISDASITADVVNEGLVLVFKQGGKTSSSLPVEEKSTTGSQYWYHQVTEGNLLISADTYGAAKAPDASNAIKYFIATPQKRAELEQKGYSLDRLMSLSYAEVAELF